MAKGLHYIATLDNTDLKKKFADQRKMILDSGKTAQAQGQMVENSFKKIAQNMAMIGGGLSAGYLAKELYTFAGAFDKSMKEVSTISKTVDADMDGFKSSVLEMTTQVPVGADAAAKALYQIVSAGHDGANGMKVLEVAAKAAIGGVTETVTAADAITTVLNAYKKDAGEAENISDQLFTTVRLGKTTFGELGQSISQAVPIAASFGIETEQVLAAVATLTKSGTPTAQAMTQIRASIVAASKVLGDGYFQTHTFQEGLNEIAQRAGGSESKLRALIPEIEGMNGVLGLTGINAKTAAADLAELGRSTGATQQAFAKMNDEAGAQMTILKNTVLKKFHGIGEGAVDMVGSFAKLLNSDGLFNDKVIDDVIASLVVLIATVGTYKASVMAMNAIQQVSTSVQYAAEMAELTKLLPAKQADANADIMSAVAKGRLSQATAERLIAMRAEVAAELDGLKTKAQVAQVELASAIQADKNALRRSVAAKQNMALAQSQMQIAIQGGNADEIAAAKKAAQSAKIEMNSAAIAKNTTQQALGTAQTNASSTSLAVDTMQQNINTAATNGGTIAKNLFSAATLRLTKAFRSLKVAFATNPIGMILTGVTMAISLFSMFGSKVDDTSGKIKDITTSLKEYSDQQDEMKSKTEELKRVMDDDVSTAYSKQKAYESLIELYPELIGKYTQEEIKLMSLIDLTKELSRINGIREKENIQEGYDAALAKVQRIDGLLEGAHGPGASLGLRRALENAEKDLEEWRKKLNDYKKTEAAANPAEVTVASLQKNITELEDQNGEIDTLIANAIKKREENPGLFIPFDESEGYYQGKKQKNVQKISTLKVSQEGLKQKNTPQTAEEIAAAKKAAEDYAKFQKEYQDDRLASLKDAKAAELDLERDAIKNKIKLIEFERDARIEAIREGKEAYKQKHGENADTSGFDRQETAASQQADANIQEQVQEDTKARLVAMQEHLKEYGTFQQKKYAIAEEYARKIKEAQTEGERLSLEKELASYTSNMQAQDIKMNIDWVTVFGEFGGMFSEMIKPALEDAKKYLSTDAFKNADEASKRALIEAVAQMEAAVGGAGSLGFKQMGVDMQTYQNSLITLNRVKQEEIESIEKLKEAQGKYEEALKSGSQTEIDTTKTNLDNAQTNTDAAAENVQAQTDTTNNFKQQVNNTAASLRGGMEDITNNINKLASGSFAGAYEGIVGLMKSLGGADTALGKLAEKLDIPIISWVLGLLDALKDGLSDIIGGVLDGIFNAISGIISDVLSGDLFITIGESISKGLFSIIKSIFTMGGLFSFMDNESDPDLQADVDRLTASNERLEESLNRLTDKMDGVATSEATSVYKEQLDNVKDREQNSQEMMQREAEAWARFGYGFAGLGGKSSSNSKINDNISGSEWDKISQVVGRNISNAGDFWGLSSEEMAKVADEAGGIYDKIKGYADDGHKDAAKYMDDYISYAKEREELEKAYYEKLTSTSFDSVRDEFKNTLLDMESDAEDFATNFEKMMQNAIIESLMSTKYDAKLKEWYKNFAAAMEDGDMTQAEKDALRNDYNNINNEGLKDRDALKDIFGWDDESESPREASKRGIATASQESVDENNGRLTSIQGHTYDINESIKLMQPDISSIRNSMAFIRDNAIAQLTAMRGIESNTAPISELRIELGYVKSALETIRDRGVTIWK